MNLRKACEFEWLCASSFFSYLVQTPPKMSNLPRIFCSHWSCRQAFAKNPVQTAHYWLSVYPRCYLSSAFNFATISLITLSASSYETWHVPTWKCPPPPYFSIKAPTFVLHVLFKTLCPTAIGQFILPLPSTTQTDTFWSGYKL